MNESATKAQGGDRELSVMVTRELIEQFLATQEREVSLDEKEQERFITTALVFQLNPFKREIHAKVNTENGKRRLSIIVGYEVYLKKAERTGKLDGWKAWVEGAGESLKAVVEIHRSDWTHPFVHEVYWSEAVQKEDDGTIPDFWKRMPRFQLKKVAISQGFRLCFSDQIGGMPYEGAELSLETSPSESSEQADEKPSQSKQSDGGLAEEIHQLVMDHADILSAQHMEWIETQLRMEKTAAQLKGLLKHVTQAIQQGGDTREQGNRPAPPRTGMKRRAPQLKPSSSPATSGSAAL